MKKKYIIKILLLLFFFVNLYNKISFAENKNLNAEELVNKSREAYKKGDKLGALTYLANSLEIFRELNYEQGILANLATMGETYREIGEYDKALEYLNEALSISKRVGSQEGTSSILESISDIHYYRNDYTKALECSLESLRIYEKCENKKRAALILSRIGIFYSNLHNYVSAFESFNDSIRIREEINDREGVAANLANIGTMYKDIGIYNKALEYYNESLKICAEIANEELAEYIITNIGTIDQTNGKYNSALEYYTKSLKIAKKIGLKQRMTVILVCIGTVYGDLNNCIKALEYFNDALGISKELNDNSTVAGILVNIGVAHIALGAYPRAIKSFDESLEIYKDINNKSGVSASLRSIGTVYYWIGNYVKALEYYSEALSIDTKIGDMERIAFNLLNIGFTYFYKGNYSSALEFAGQAHKIASRINDLKLICQTTNLLACISEKNNDYASALSYYKTSIDTIESIRGGLKLEAHKLSFVEDKMNVYKNIILLLLKLGKKEEAFDYVERAKSRALLDLLGNKVKPKKAGNELSEEERELQNRINALLEQVTKESSKPREQQRGSAIAQNTQELQKLRTRHQEVINSIKQKDPEFASFLSVEPLKSAEVTGLLDKDTTLLEYYVTENKLLIWIINNGKLNALEVPVKETELTDAVAALRASIENRSDNYKEVSRKLYKLLIEPAKPYLNTTQLCIVPHKALHYLSFSTLLNNDKFLVEDYSLFYSPNASLLKFCFDKRKESINNLLAFGNPDNSLENSEIEVNRIKQDFSKSQVFIREAATESKAKELTDNYDIVHFACHGELNPVNPLYSHLKLAKDAQQDGRLEVWEIYEMDLKSASLITLSACKTALGNITNGDEIIGLTRGFIYAGSPSIVASLWDIDDVSTSALMQEFYSNLKSNHPKTESLRRAQLKLIKDKNKGISKERGFKLTEGTVPADPSHPYYWAAFVLIGDWK